MSREDRELGLYRDISRRDFLGGFGLAVTGSLAYPWSQAHAVPAALQSARGRASGYYPPTETGMRGNHPGSWEVAHELRDGGSWDVGDEGATGESYDLVVVGGGLSGLAAAHFFRKQAGSEARILILDNHDDFGGHAKRNEFRYGGRTLLSNGGTVYVEDFAEYTSGSRTLLRDLGFDVERFSEYANRQVYDDLRLKKGVFFDRETFGRDHLVVGAGERPWPELLAEAPLSEKGRHDIARLHTETVDYMRGLSLAEKEQRLRAMSYEDYLVRHAGIAEEVLPYFRLRSDYWAVGGDALPAWVAMHSSVSYDWDTDYPGFQGLGFPEAEEHRPQYFRFPDGNASIARLLVRGLVPEVASGDGMEDIVTARFDYDRLDHPSSRVRIRLDSTVVSVRHQGDPGRAKMLNVVYVRHGQAQKVSGARCVLACYNSVIPHLCPELPEAQKEALGNALKAPLVYSRVLLRNWQSFARLGVLGVSCPGGYHKMVLLSDPVSLGEYRASSAPDEPMVLDLRRIPAAPGRPAAEQFVRGRNDIQRTTFETFERKIRDQLARVLGAGGFDPARDIEAITINRWPHGYAYGYDPVTKNVAFLPGDWPDSRKTWLEARRPFGRIAIANSDAGASAMTESAMSQAERAVNELAR